MHNEPATATWTFSGSRRHSVEPAHAGKIERLRFTHAIEGEHMCERFDQNSLLISKTPVIPAIYSKCLPAENACGFLAAERSDTTEWVDNQILLSWRYLAGGRS